MPVYKTKQKKKTKGSQLSVMQTKLIKYVDLLRITQILLVRFGSKIARGSYL